LHKLLAENPAGIYIVRDELSGLLAELDKETRKGDRQLLMSCWNGSGTYESDRIGRGNTYAKNLCASMFGSLQPGRLRSYLNDVMQDRPGNDGLLQRFQVLVYPDFSADYESIDLPANQEAFDKLVMQYSDLTSLNAESPLHFRFAPDAQRLFAAFDVDVQRKVRDRNTHPAMQAHLSKYDSLIAKLAMLFTLADGGRDGLVDMKHAQQAINFCGYLESHARRIYSLIISPERAAASELGYHLLNEGWKRHEGCFTLRDIYRHHWTGLDTSEKARAAIEILIDHGWLRPIESDKNNGRPSEIFAINPKLARMKG
jgi:putative DNA primase/helicase